METRSIRRRPERFIYMWMTLTPRNARYPARAAPLPSTRRPTTIPSGRTAGGAVKDPFWQSLVHRQGLVDGRPGQRGCAQYSPICNLREAHKMIPFLEAGVSGRKRWASHKSPEGTVLHATIRIGKRLPLEIDEAHGESQPMPCPPACLRAGHGRGLRSCVASQERHPLRRHANAPYGDRAAGVKDAFGNNWFYRDVFGTVAAGLKTRHSSVRNLAEKGAQTYCGRYTKCRA